MQQSLKSTGPRGRILRTSNRWRSSVWDKKYSNIYIHLEEKANKLVVKEMGSSPWRPG